MTKTDSARMQQQELISFPSSSASVATLFSAVLPPLEGAFLYEVEPGHEHEVVVGSRLNLPFGRRIVAGFVVSVGSDTERSAAEEMARRGVRIRRIKPDEKGHLSFGPAQLELYSWISKFYSEPISRILDLAVPPYAPDRADPVLRLVQPAATPSPPRLGAAQRRVLELLSANPSGLPCSELAQRAGASQATIRALEAKGLVLRDGPARRVGMTSQEIARMAPAVPLSGEQRLAADRIVSSIAARRFESFLLHGVTGSGKTEVYLDAIIAALHEGRSALVVVPEIALTPQLTERFERRLGCKVAVLHSSLKPKDRWRHWEDLLHGRTRVVIGARSAIFAPLDNVGIIIVDEEHDQSFKQGEGIRYHARDLALVRAKQACCPVVLGSATPSLESYHHARSGKHTLLTLSKRHFGSAPLVYKLIDLNGVKPWTMPSKSISAELLGLLNQTLARKEQAFILYNRRGFASYLQCTKCEYVLGCPHCSVTLTFHRTPNSLLCHFCGFTAVPPMVCVACGAAETVIPDPSAERDPLFVQRGAGTERVYEELQSLLPKARLGKLDRDAVSSVEDYVKVLSDVRQGNVDILVGTQMIAKGHDLPDVTLVGVVDCDVGLHVPDFRAGERVFHLLTQVSGRAGRRDRQGYVVLQTRVPQHISLKMTVKENFVAFAEFELEARKALGYPPFQRLLRIILASPDRNQARSSAEQLCQVAAPLAEQLGVTVLGPAPAPIEKVRNHWRHHLLCKAASPSVLQALMHRIKERIDPPEAVRVIFDIDPQDML